MAYLEADGGQSVRHRRHERLENYALELIVLLGERLLESDRAKCGLAARRLQFYVQALAHAGEVLVLFERVSENDCLNLPAPNEESANHQKDLLLF